MEHARTSKSSMAQRHHGGRACPPGGSAVRRAPGQDGRGGASDDRGPSRMSRDDRRRAPVHVDLECTRHPRAFNDKLLRGESRLASRWRPSPKKKLAQARYVSGEKGDTRVFAAFEERKTRFAWPCLSSATAAPLRWSCGLLEGDAALRCADKGFVSSVHVASLRAEPPSSPQSHA